MHPNTCGVLRACGSCSLAKARLEKSLKDQYLLMKPVPSRMWNIGKEANVPLAMNLKVSHGIQRIP